VDNSLIFRQLFDADSATYTYLLADPISGEAVLIDPVFEQYRRDRALLEELGLTLLYTLDTHCHADHVTGAWLMQQALGSKIGISGRYGPMVTGADQLLDQGDRVRFGDRYLEVRATPGHTDGCLTYVLDDHTMAFTGDCLLIRGAGRCDFQQGNASTMYHSITEQIFSLPDSCLVYPAHDYIGRTVSTVAEEKQYNPRIGGQADERDFVGYMDNLGLPHPKKIDRAIPANCVCGRPDPAILPSLVSWGPVYLTYAGIREISPQWLGENLAQVHVLDVREVEEFNGPLGHIANAQLIPLPELAQRIDEIPPHGPLVTVCQSGRRSAQATVILAKQGWTEATSLQGGMRGWQAANLPVTRG
jgi:glyoxylase-like metal-dependent hydrolase (beta-lactamase superfamily II)/rhodanese-related sulfurtransferase